MRNELNNRDTSWVGRRVFEPISDGEELYGDAATRLRMWRISGRATRKKCASQLTVEERLEVLPEEPFVEIAMRLAEGVSFAAVRELSFSSADLRAAAWLGSSRADPVQFAEALAELAEIDVAALSRCMPVGWRFQFAQNEVASLIAAVQFDVDVLWGMELANTPDVMTAVWERLTRASGEELWWCAVTLAEAGAEDTPYARACIERAGRSEAIDGLEAFLDGRQWQNKTHAGERVADACMLKWLSSSPEVGLLDENGLEQAIQSTWAPVGDVLLQNPSLRRDQIPRALSDTSDDTLVQWLRAHDEVTAEEYVGALSSMHSEDEAAVELRRAWERLDDATRRRAVELMPADEVQLPRLAQVVEPETLRQVLGRAEARAVVALDARIWFAELLGAARDVLEIGTLVKIIKANPEVLWEDALAAVVALTKGSTPHPELNVDESGLDDLIDPPF